MHNEERIDIAPMFRNLLAISPLEVLRMMKDNLVESGNESLMIKEVLNSVDKELQSRFSGVKEERRCEGEIE